MYAAGAKVELAGLDPELLEEHGTVSATTTGALAEAIRDRSTATYGVAVTGWAGPTAGPGEAVALPVSSENRRRCLQQAK